MDSEKADYYKHLSPLFRVGLDMKFDRAVHGVENIPDEPAIYAPNHVRFADSPLVAVSYTEATGRPMRFGAKREYFDGEGIDGQGKLGRTLRWVMEHGHMIPVDRENTNPRAFQQLDAAVGDRLTRGDAVALHPEGTRSEDGRLHKFKSGAARIALKWTVPILPKEYRSFPALLFLGKYKADFITQVVENRVADMTGMPQTGAFAQLRKFRMPKN